MINYNNLKVDSNKIKIDVVSDVVCPWCIIGFKRLEKAIKELGLEDRFEIEWQPFELNPQMPEEGENIVEHIRHKYGSSTEDFKRSTLQMTQMGEELGFTFDYYDEMRMPNTVDAHILLDYAKDSGKQTELNLRLASAHFGEHKNISKREVLLQEAKAVGLDVEQAQQRWDNEDARKDIKEKEAKWTSMGISSVPTIVFDKKSALTGAQSEAVYKQVLTQLIGE